MSEMFVGVVCLFVMFILTCLNIVICQFDSWLLWFIHVLLILFIPIVFISMFDILYFDFANMLSYLLMGINVYLSVYKLLYLYSIKDIREG